MPAVYLFSDMSRSVTGEVHHVDAGYHIVGMKNPAAPDIGQFKEGLARHAIRLSRATVSYYMPSWRDRLDVRPGRLQGQRDIQINLDVARIRRTRRRSG